MQPCPWCVLQRLIFVALALVALLGLLWSSRPGRRVAASIGIVPDVADDGLQVVQMARAAPYDLILMDIQMPGLDGLQATRELRSRGATHGVPIVAITAGAFAEDRNACLAAGMNDHIAKPIELSALYAVLRRWLPTAR
jgi:CheY-like chemotaxis protein